MRLNRWIAIASFALTLSACGGGGDSGGGGTYDPNAPSTLNSFSSVDVINYYTNPTSFILANAGTCRFNTSIPIFTNNNQEVLDAITRIETTTEGRVTFTIVNSAADIISGNLGIIVEEGNATNGNGSPGCGELTNVPGWPGDMTVTSSCLSGVMNGYFYLRLGSSGCNDATAGWFPSAVAEHELGHALIYSGQHTTRFTGDEGLSGELLALILTMYDNPPNTPTANLVPLLPQDLAP